MSSTPEDRHPHLDTAVVRRAVVRALQEDGARNDVTTQALVPPDQRGTAAIVCEDEGVLCALPVARTAFAGLDETVQFQAMVPEGAAVSPGDELVALEGPLASILSAERVALNFLQRLSGVATATRLLVEAVAGLDVRIVDTRKTTPGLRALERYAVRVGGGRNHRFNLADGVLIKDNHIAAARTRGLSLAQIVEQARLRTPHTLRVEIEVTTVDEAREALDGGADIVLLDNMSVQGMRQVVATVDGRALLEASGGVTLESVRAIAETGVDIISTGGITHSAPALDMSLQVQG